MTHMAKIDVHSLTWKTVLKFAEAQRKEAVAELIADINSNQQRGKIEILDALIGLHKEEQEEIVHTDNYPT